MILVYEIIHRSVVPAIRYLIADNLVKKHNLTQRDAAIKLGITQAAISNYLRRTRATAINLSEYNGLRSLINELTITVLNNHPNDPEVIIKFTEICEKLRFNKFLCKFHKELDPNYEIRKCYACNKKLS
jgi:predicted transcriptional regulator